MAVFGLGRSLLRCLEREWMILPGVERATSFEVSQTNDKLFSPTHPIEHLLEHFITDCWRVNAARFKLGAQASQRLLVAAIEIGLKVQHAAFDHLSVIVD